MIQTKEKRELLGAYGVKEGEFSLLNSGENDTFLFQSGDKKFVIRRYRHHRYTLQQVKAEVAWMRHVRSILPVPEIVENINGYEITKLGSRFYLAFEYIDGNGISTPNHQDYARLGSLLSTFHSTIPKVNSSLELDRSLQSRPSYKGEDVIYEAISSLCSASFLSNQQKEQCERKGEEMKKWLPHLSNDQFIHGDVFFGNIIESGEQWYLLDFDECGFGDRAFDIGVPRMHLLASSQLETYWPSFSAAYENMPSEETVRAGTALRIMYMMGKIPKRLDIDHIKENPSRFIERYMELIDSELSGASFI
ncbi:serine kinase [Pontibacillus chungwhensis BH030062]|uniref:Serine kinase n=1 Tax=Pontibacillus chungwhensis BH030062 TaxID=1385513 RepID=A0A0A2URR0_9BACI|nr:phosphotransferase [Pontibacillus chungwhensis]KGP90629.1 serine kinase [Pontibacillus chungwhensis BH030062]